MAIERVFLCPNGAVVVFDDKAQQVLKWQDNLFCGHLRKMYEAGVIDGDTPVEQPGRITKASDWIPV